MLLPKDGEDSASVPVFDRFRGSLAFELDRFQCDACRALESGRDVLVAAPTGAGKTVVGEFSVYLALRQGRKAFYTTPIKALSNQKFAELVEAYGSGAVGLLTGDVSLNPEAQVVVMTTEVLRNMLYTGSSTLNGLAYVVMDEVHYLADRLRGAAWEEVIIHLPAGVGLVCLSATISNAEEFGAWLTTVRGDTVVVVSEERPVPLFQHMMAGKEIFDLFDTHTAFGGVGKEDEGEALNAPALNHELLALSRGATPAATAENTEPQRGRSRQFEREWGHGYRTGKVPWAQRLQRLNQAGFLPAIAFIFSRAGCDAAVQGCLVSGLRLTSGRERSEILGRVERIRLRLPPEDLQVLGFDAWREGLRRGYAAHHAGLLPEFKEIVEKLFSDGLLKAVFATETLALGINMPARSVVLERLEKFNGEMRVPLTAGEYTQLTGRAGRRGLDREGHAIVVWQPGDDPAAVAALASRRTYPLISSFRPTYNMSANLIFQLGRNRSLELLKSSFAQFQADHSSGHLPEPGPTEAAEEFEPDTRERRPDVRRSLPETFERISDVLVRYGYVEAAGTDLVLSSRGQQLRRIYGERDLLVSLSIDDGAFDRLSAAELAGVVTAAVYRTNSAATGGPGKMATPQIGVAVRRIMNTWMELSAIEEQLMLPGTREPEKGLIRPMYTWACGGSLRDALSGTELSAGDFVHWARRSVDLLGQLSKLGGLAGDVGERFAEARRLVHHGVVAQATPGSSS